MRKLLVVVLICSVSFAASCTSEGNNPDVPGFPERPVLDNAEMLSDSEEGDLNQKVESFETRSGMQIRILTVKSVAPFPTASEYSQLVYTTWKLGDSVKRNGLLVVITKAVGSGKPEPRDFSRIMTGWGTTQILPDEEVKQIKHQYLVPDGVSNTYAGLNTTLDVLFGRILQWQEKNPGNQILNPPPVIAAQFQTGPEPTPWYLTWWGITLIVIVVLVLLYLFLRLLGRATGSRVLGDFGCGSGCGGGSTGCGSGGGGGCGGGGCS